MKGFRSFLIIIFLLNAVLLSGCASKTEFTQRPLGGEKIQSTHSSVAGLHAHLLGLNNEVNGEQLQKNPPLAQLLKRRFEDAGLFSEVRVEPALLINSVNPGKMDWLSDKVVEMNASLIMTDDVNLGPNLAKAAVIGLTLYLATPAVNFTQYFTSHFEVEVVRWDGVTKRYKAEAATTAYYKYFANNILAPLKSKQEAMDAAIYSVVNQMVRDDDFFRWDVKTAQLQ